MMQANEKTETGFTPGPWEPSPTGALVRCPCCRTLQTKETMRKAQARMTQPTKETTMKTQTEQEAFAREAQHAVIWFHAHAEEMLARAKSGDPEFYERLKAQLEKTRQLLTGPEA